MRIKKFPWLCAMIALILPLSAQEHNVRLQPFASDGFSVSRVNGTKSDIVTAGMAVVAPISEKFFIRPFVGAGRSFAIEPSQPTPSVPVLQVGTVVGYHATKRFSLVSGFMENAQFPATGTLYLPTFVASTVTRIHGRWGLFTPFTVNQRSYGIAAQLGYTW